MMVGRNGDIHISPDLAMLESDDEEAGEQSNV
jgi:hypothetical protein